MAMTATLWSVNGLATELGIDRRTIAKRLSTVPPDGELRGNPAWRLRTALDAVNGNKARSTHPWVTHYLSRVRDWEEIHTGEPIQFTIAEAAEAFAIDEEQILTWLRAGMGFAKRGDWRTGKGFLVIPSHIVDFQICMRAISRAVSDDDFLSAMRIIE